MAGPLTLTTPPMHGPDVRRAQKLLNENRFGDFLDGDINAVFDDATARACRLARYWLGYRGQDQVAVFGSQLAGYLAGTKRLPPVRRARRELRKRLTPKRQKRARLKALAIAKRQLDTPDAEHPDGSNNTKYTRWYMRHPDGWQSDGPEWCAIFITWCYAHAGWPTDAFNRDKNHWASCPAMRDAAVAGNYDLSVRRKPQPGDLAIYDLPPTTAHDSLANHIGMFEEWIDDDHRTFTAIEGNLGDKVVRETRDRSIVTVFIRVGKDQHPPG